MDLYVETRTENLECPFIDLYSYFFLLSRCRAPSPVECERKWMRWRGSSGKKRRRTRQRRRRRRTNKQYKRRKKKNSQTTVQEQEEEEDPSPSSQWAVTQGRYNDLY